MEIKRIPLKSLKYSSFNPKERTGKKSKKMPALIKSIEAIGLIYPIAITKEGRIIDGHRRATAAKLLGWEDIPAIEVQCEDENAVYADVNATNCPLTAHERLCVWLKNPLGVTARQREKLSKFEEIFGRKMMERTASYGYSSGIFNTCLMVSRYVGKADDRTFPVRVLAWLIKHQNQGVIHSFMRLEQTPNTLRRAIVSGRKLEKYVRVSS